MNDKSIMPECYADTLLIQTLIPTKQGYNHKHNCFKVETAMAKGELKDKFALGIIDNDKKAIRYLNEFEIINNYNEELKLWQHKEKHHYIIQFCPALEKWIIGICKEGNINLNEYGLDNSLEGLKKHTKSIVSLTDEKLNRLFKAIKNKSEEIASVQKLTKWVTLLKNKQYQVDINELRNV